jgi:hypothetical protein
MEVQNYNINIALLMVIGMIPCFGIMLWFSPKALHWVSAHCSSRATALEAYRKLYKQRMDKFHTWERKVAQPSARTVAQPSQGDIQAQPETVV